MNVVSLCYDLGKSNTPERILYVTFAVSVHPCKKVFKEA